MAKYEEISSFNEEIFVDFVSGADLERVLNVKVLADNKQKSIYKVSKATPREKHMTNEDVFIILNEKIFDGLEDNQKRLIADEAITYIGYDFEKDKLKIDQPNRSMFSGILAKYTYPVCEQVYECVKSLYDAKNNNESEDGVSGE